MYYLHCTTDPKFSLNLLTNVSCGLGALDTVQIVYSRFSIHFAQSVFYQSEKLDSNRWH